MIIGGIYKKGQGYWTRLMSAIAMGLIVLLGVIWLWDLLAAVKIGNVQTIFVQATAAVISGAVFGLLGFAGSTAGASSSPLPLLMYHCCQTDSTVFTIQ